MLCCGAFSSSGSLFLHDEGCRSTAAHATYSCRPLVPKFCLKHSTLFLSWCCCLQLLSTGDKLCVHPPTHNIHPHTLRDAPLSAALLLGASSAVGTDTDPLAIRAAAANAALNGLQDRMQVLQCAASLSDPDPLLQVSPTGGITGRV